MNIPKKKLSKSACAKYLQCAAGYDYHYNQNIRPIKVGSALVFGNGIDAMLNELLLADHAPILAYRASVAKFPLGKVIPGKYDFDGDLLTDQDRSDLLIDLKEYGYTGDDVDGLVSALMQKSELSENQSKALDLIIRRVLEAKARLMLNAYRQHVLPHIEKVHNVQKASGPGFLDATVEWKGRGKVVVDHKTSARAYPEDSCDYSLELALYAGEEKVNNVAYVVLIKTIKKNRVRVCELCDAVSDNNRVKTCDQIIDGERCGGNFTVTIQPEAEIQVVHGEITERALEVATEVQTEIGRAVGEKIFFCNFKDCNSQFGKPCEYKNLHWKGDMTGFEVIQPKAKK